MIDLPEPSATGVIPIFSVFGASPNDLLGWSLACADFDGDGLQDLVTGARGVAPRGRTAAGEVLLIPGNRVRLTSRIDLRSLTQAQAAAAAQFMGDDPGDSLGAALAAADLNGDGLDDLIVGVPGGDGPDNRSPGRGEILVIWGVPEIRASRIDFDSDGEIAPIGETRIFGRDSERLAGSALAAGDCDGDGLADLIVRSESEDGSDAMHLIAGRQIEPSSTLNLSEEASQETLNSDSPWPLSAGAVSTLGSSDAVH